LEGEDEGGWPKAEGAPKVDGAPNADEGVVVEGFPNADVVEGDDDPNAPKHPPPALTPPNAEGLAAPKADGAPKADVEAG
jgi:hypothetical protein